LMYLRIGQLLLLSAVLFLSPSLPVPKYESVLAAPDANDSSENQWTLRYTPSEDRVTRAKLEPETGAYLGAYVLQDDYIGQSMDRFNETAGRTHASFFKYVGYGKPFPVQWVRDVVKAGAFPHIAWEPNEGLDKVKDDGYLRRFARQANSSGVPILLRFASEMNGNWTAYSGNPELYKEKWRLVHDVFEQEAPDTAMLWSVLAMPEKPMADYYPGDDYVDWVGVNIYSVRYHNGDRNYAAHQEDPLDLLNAVYNRYSRTKPIAVSEFGASHYSATDGKTDVAFAAAKLKRFYGSLEQLYPRVKAVYYFDVNNTTAFNPARRVNDYSITGQQTLLDTYKEATASDYYGARAASASDIAVKVNHGDTRRRESYTFRGKLFESNGVVYADTSFFIDYLGLRLTRLPQGNNGSDGKERVIVERKKGHETIAVTTEVMRRSVEAGYNNSQGAAIRRKLQAIAVLETVRALGYEAAVVDTDIRIEE
jgi:hypothetical protein